MLQRSLNKSKDSLNGTTNKFNPSMNKLDIKANLNFNLSQSSFLSARIMDGKDLLKVKSEEEIAKEKEI